MMTSADLPGTIPVFPLPGALMLPRARLPLHIFEPRYLAMLDDTMKTSHRLIGMVQPREVPGSGETPACTPSAAPGVSRSSRKPRTGAT
jgi:Lon protease-like protein